MEYLKSRRWKLYTKYEISHTGARADTTYNVPMPGVGFECVQFYIGDTAVGIRPDAWRWMEEDTCLQSTAGGNDLFTIIDTLTPNILISGVFARYNILVQLNDDDFVFKYTRFPVSSDSVVYFTHYKSL